MMSPFACTRSKSCFPLCISHHVVSFTNRVQTEAVLPRTNKKRRGVWNSILFSQPLLNLILLPWTLPLFNSHMSVHLWCKGVNACAVPCWAGTCWWANKVAIVLSSCRLSQGVQWHRGAASSKFGLAKVNDWLHRLKDCILIYLFVPLFLPMYSVHYPAPCTCIAYSSSCEAHM